MFDLFRMVGLTVNWDHERQRSEKRKNNPNKHEDIDSYTRKLLDKNMKELDKHRGV